jgi:hypothetical protein
MAAAVRRFWPTALLYSSAVRRQAATGCLEDTAWLSRNVAHLGGPLSAVRWSMTAAGPVGVEWWCQLVRRCASRCELASGRSYRGIRGGRFTLAGGCRHFQPSALL